MDVIVKTRFAKHLIGGGDPDAESVYRWMMYERCKERIKAGLPTDGWKMEIDDWVNAFDILVKSIYDNGLLSQYAIPIDKNHQLLNGSHRLGAAIAWNISDVYVYKCPKDAWAPPWGLQWFEEHGISPEEHTRLIQEWNEALKI